MSVGEDRSDAWPCTIVMDRYSGVYSGGSWIAWNQSPAQIEAEGGRLDGQFADDTSCAEFWGARDRSPDDFPSCGKGATPQDAYEGMVASLVERERKWLETSGDE